MTRPTALSEQDVTRRLSDLEGWALADGKLYRAFRFGSFVEAFGFMSGVALVAEKMDHHPEWANVYDRVRVHLVTHDAGGVTELDLELAARMHELAGSGQKTSRG